MTELCIKSPAMATWRLILTGRGLKSVASQWKLPAAALTFNARPIGSQGIDIEEYSRFYY